MRLTGIDGALATLQSLPPEVVSKRGGPVKKALRRGAVVIQKAEKANLRAITSNATASGRNESTGLLLKNVVVTRGKAPNDGKGERYLVRVKKATYRRNGEIVTTHKTAQLSEYGSSQQPAEPWIRPAVISKGAEAIKTVERELVKEIDKVVAKLASQNKGR